MSDEQEAALRAELEQAQNTILRQIFDTNEHVAELAQKLRQSRAELEQRTRECAVLRELVQFAHENWANVAHDATSSCRLCVVLEDTAPAAAAWEAKLTEPLRAQIAALHDTLSALLSHNRPATPKEWANAVEAYDASLSTAETHDASLRTPLLAQIEVLNAQLGAAVMQGRLAENQIVELEAARGDFADYVQSLEGQRSKLEQRIAELEAKMRGG